ncbi:hypothetical protein [Clostridium sp. 'White wine YQ']|uniref:hypothetical protein n=1 Tax=Clostridium sp. 'White wine YQ' TaxID=3027474 RepID=UPI0023655991|nr:hypothetical protein [Clostridium sp. 'White wine YQ']MDD7794281.1 hypothetical protein [Clostridium sp. 'White wine YQ']
MIDKEKDIEIEEGIYLKRNLEQKEEASKPINTLLAFGPVNMGLSNMKNEESYAEQRIKEDLRK